MNDTLVYTYPFVFKRTKSYIIFALRKNIEKERETSKKYECIWGRFNLAAFVCTILHLNPALSSASTK